MYKNISKFVLTLVQNCITAKKEAYKCKSTHFQYLDKGGKAASATPQQIRQCYYNCTFTSVCINEQHILTIFPTYFYSTNQVWHGFSQQSLKHKWSTFASRDCFKLDPLFFLILTGTPLNI